LYSSLNIKNVIKSRGMKWAVLADQIGEEGNSYKILSGDRGN
jgi:hypothetical protein